jgi:tripartite-type tricarboxylate transporter receptor subunit TctC
MNPTTKKFLQVQGQDLGQGSLPRRTLLRGALALTVLPAWTGPSAWAQGAAAAWPDKPVRFVLSQPAGSGPDNVARIIGERLAKGLGQPLVMDNKPGGQNVIGAQAAARSAADGYTFYFATTAALVTNSYLFKTLPYDPQKDFVPVAFVGKSPFAVLVRADSPVQSLQDLLARARSTPGKVSLGNEGPRTFSGMIARFLNARAKAEFNLTPYASVSVAVQDAIGGHVDAVVADIASTAQLVRQGRLRMLAVTTAKRVAGWDQVPAVAETYSGFDLSGWFALVAPAATPRPVIERMNQEFNAVTADKEVAAKILSAGPVAESGMSLDQVAAFLKDEHQRWSQITRELGVLPE